MKTFLAMLAVVVILTGAGCSTWHKVPSSQCQGFAPAMDATVFLSQLRAKGDLPGIPKDTPSYGHLFYGSFFEKAPPAPSLPQDHFFFVASPTEQDRYLMYTVRKESETASWKLIRAWVADRTGKELKVLKEAD